MHQDAAQAVLDALGNGRVPGFTTSGPDGDGEADGLGGQGLGMATHVEASPGAIGEAGQTSQTSRGADVACDTLGEGEKWQEHQTVQALLLPSSRGQSLAARLSLGGTRMWKLPDIS